MKLIDLAGTEKLKNISNSNYLNISKLIHEFKTPLNCIIGLSDESQLLMGSSKSNLIKNFDLLKDDIERINGLSNYTVFLIKDLTDYLKKLNENKKLNEKNVGDTVTICGWLQTVRYSKFLILRDLHGHIQVNLDEAFFQENKLFSTELLTNESVLAVNGIVELRPLVNKFFFFYYVDHLKKH